MAKGIVLIDEDRCKGCGLCVTVCPKHILRLAERRFNAKGYQPIEVTAPEACTGCTLCAVICPDVVFTVYRQRRKQRSKGAEEQGSRGAPPLLRPSAPPLLREAKNG
jgi:2-oxoglutarate ferredoxin oxidoreductase subunit delta